MTRIADRDLYAALGVAPSASSEEITNAFREHAKDLHPDRHGGDPVLAEEFKALASAYSVLTRPAARAAYDRRRAARAVPPERPAPTAAERVFTTTRGARIALWSGVVLVLFGVLGAGVLASLDTGDAAKAITLWIVVAKLVVCGAILWGAGSWRLRHSGSAHRVTGR